MTTVFYVILLYVMVSVDGTSGHISTPALYATECRDDDLQLHCDMPDHVIHVIGVYLGEGPGRGSGCDLEEGDCFIHDADFYEDVMDACHQQPACMGIRVPNVCDYCEDDPDKHTFDYGLVEYRCIYNSTSCSNLEGEASRLNNDNFDDVTCGPDATIQVINGFYGDTGSEGLGSNGDISICDCRVNVDADYMETITDSCDGQRSCGDLRAQRSSGTYCNPDGWPNEYSEYVTIVYRCLDPATSPGSPTTETENYTADLPTQRSPNISSNTGYIVAIGVAVPLAIATAIIVILLSIRRERKLSTTTQTACVSGVNPAIDESLSTGGPGEGQPSVHQYASNTSDHAPVKSSTYQALDPRCQYQDLVQASRVATGHLNDPYTTAEYGLKNLIDCGQYQTTSTLSPVGSAHQLPTEDSSITDSPYEDVENTHIA